MDEARTTEPERWPITLDVQPAANLEDVIFYCNPTRSLDGEYLKFYIDRGSYARRDMAT